MYVMLRSKILKIKYLILKKPQHKIKKLQRYDLSLFIGQSYLFNDGAQLTKYFKCFIILQKD